MSQGLPPMMLSPEEYQRQAYEQLKTPAAPLMSVAPPPPPPPPPQELPQSGPLMSMAPPTQPVQSVAPKVEPSAQQEKAPQPEVTPFSERMAMPQLVSRGHTSPAHEARTAPQSVLGAYDKAMTSEQAAGENIASRNILGAEARADVYRDEAEEAQQRAAAVEAASAKRSEELEARKKDFDETSATLAKTKIDPNRRWNEMSGGEKALNVFSILVGAVADGATGRENRALAQFEKQMERDINAQKFAYETGMNRLDQQRNAYALALQKYGSEDAAANVARMSYLDAAKMKIEQAMESAQGDQAKNKLDAMYADIDGKRADLLAKTTTIVQAKSAEPMVRDPETGAVVPLSKYNERMWQRGEKQFGSRLDAEKEVTVQGAKADAKARTEDVDMGAREISKAMDPIIVARQSAENARAALVAAPAGLVERAARTTAIGSRVVDAVSDESMYREQAWKDFENAAIKAVAGNATENEVHRMLAGIGPNSSNKARMATIKRVNAVLDQQDRNANARGSKEAQDEYARRVKNANSSVASPLGRVKSFKPSGGE